MARLAYRASCVGYPQVVFILLNTPKVSSLRVFLSQGTGKHCRNVPLLRCVVGHFDNGVVDLQPVTRAIAVGWAAELETHFESA